jgi:hypothetical protein
LIPPGSSSLKMVKRPNRLVIGRVRS